MDRPIFDKWIGLINAVQDLEKLNTFLQYTASSQQTANLIKQLEAGQPQQALRLKDIQTSIFQIKQKLYDVKLPSPDPFCSGDQCYIESQFINEFKTQLLTIEKDILQNQQEELNRLKEIAIVMKDFQDSKDSNQIALIKQQNKLLLYGLHLIEIATNSEKKVKEIKEELSVFQNKILILQICCIIFAIVCLISFIVYTRQFKTIINKKNIVEQIKNQQINNDNYLKESKNSKRQLLKTILKDNEFCFVTNQNGSPIQQQSSSQFIQNSPQSITQDQQQQFKKQISEFANNAESRIIVQDNQSYHDNYNDYKFWRYCIYFSWFVVSTLLILCILASQNYQAKNSSYNVEVCAEPFQILYENSNLHGRIFQTKYFQQGELGNVAKNIFEQCLYNTGDFKKIYDAQTQKLINDVIKFQLAYLEFEKLIKSTQQKQIEASSKSVDSEKYYSQTYQQITSFIKKLEEIQQFSWQAHSYDSSYTKNIVIQMKEILQFYTSYNSNKEYQNIQFQDCIRQITQDFYIFDETSCPANMVLFPKSADAKTFQGFGSGVCFYLSDFPSDSTRFPTLEEFNQRYEATLFNQCHPNEFRKLPPFISNSYYASYLQNAQYNQIIMLFISRMEIYLQYVYNNFNELHIELKKFQSQFMVMEDSIEESKIEISSDSSYVESVEKIIGIDEDESKSSSSTSSSSSSSTTSSSSTSSSSSYSYTSSSTYYSSSYSSTESSESHESTSSQLQQHSNRKQNHIKQIPYNNKIHQQQLKIDHLESDLDCRFLQFMAIKYENLMCSFDTEHRLKNLLKIQNFEIIILFIIQMVILYSIIMFLPKKLITNQELKTQSQQIIQGSN